MKYLYIGLCALVLCASACSQAPKHFVAPSTAAIRGKVTEIQTQTESAIKSAGEAKASISRAKVIGKGNEPLLIELITADTQIDALTQELLKTKESAKNAQTEIVTLNTKMEQVVVEANRVVADNVKMKKVVDKVNSYWGIGGILYGFGVLFKHLFILAAVLIVAALGLFALSFIGKLNPVLGPIFSFVPKLKQRVQSLFRKKPPN